MNVCVCVLILHAFLCLLIMSAFVLVFANHIYMCVSLCILCLMCACVCISCLHVCFFLHVMSTYVLVFAYPMFTWMSASICYRMCLHIYVHACWYLHIVCSHTCLWFCVMCLHVCLWRRVVCELHILSLYDPCVCITCLWKGTGRLMFNSLFFLHLKFCHECNTMLYSTISQ